MVVLSKDSKDNLFPFLIVHLHFIYVQYNKVLLEDKHPTFILHVVLNTHFWNENMLHTTILVRI